MRDDPIANVLDDLLKLDDILACMVARHNMISVMPTGDSFDPRVNQVWDIIHRAMDDVFGVIAPVAESIVNPDGVDVNVPDLTVITGNLRSVSVLGITSLSYAKKAPLGVPDSIKTVCNICCTLN